MHVNRFLTSNRGMWLYALLSRLEKPLYRDTVAHLRQLLRVCCHQRRLLAEDANLAANEHCRLADLNTIISICGLYFGQSECCRGGAWSNDENDHVNGLKVNSDGSSNLMGGDWDDGDLEGDDDSDDVDDIDSHVDEDEEDGEVKEHALEEGEEVCIDADLMDLIKIRKRTVEDAGLMDEDDVV